MPRVCRSPAANFRRALCGTVRRGQTTADRSMRSDKSQRNKNRYCDGKEEYGPAHTRQAAASYLRNHCDSNNSQYDPN